MGKIVKMPEAKPDRLSGHTMNEVWETIHRVERQPFSDKEAQLYGNVLSSRKRLNLLAEEEFLKTGNVMNEAVRKLLQAFNTYTSDAMFDLDRFYLYELQSECKESRQLKGRDRHEWAVWFFQRWMKGKIRA